MANWAGGLKRSLDFLLHFEAFWHCCLILFNYKHVEHHLFYPMTTDFMQISLEKEVTSWKQSLDPLFRQKWLYDFVLILYT